MAKTIVFDARQRGGSGERILPRGGNIKTEGEFPEGSKGNSPAANGERSDSGGRNVVDVISKVWYKKEKRNFRHSTLKCNTFVRQSNFHGTGRQNPSEILRPTLSAVCSAGGRNHAKPPARVAVESLLPNFRDSVVFQKQISVFNYHEAQLSSHLQ